MDTWELWSWRGFASFPSRPMGELMRRRCDSVDAYVSLLSTCIFVREVEDWVPERRAVPPDKD